MMAQTDIVAIELVLRGDAKIDLAAAAHELGAALAAKGPVGLPSWETPGLVHIQMPNCRVSLGLTQGANGTHRIVISAASEGEIAASRGPDVVRCIARRIASRHAAEAELWFSLAAPLTAASLQTLRQRRVAAAKSAAPIDLARLLGLAASHAPSRGFSEAAAAFAGRSAAA